MNETVHIFYLRAYFLSFFIQTGRADLTEPNQFDSWWSIRILWLWWQICCPYLFIYNNKFPFFRGGSRSPFDFDKIKMSHSNSRTGNLLANKTAADHGPLWCSDLIIRWFSPHFIKTQRRDKSGFRIGKTEDQNLEEWVRVKLHKQNCWMCGVAQQTEVIMAIQAINPGNISWSIIR